ncbi:MAG TPA: MerR family transcriptional regulator [Noviherbaspirillum sp.]|nr:MerR family transcriptional regulator [Noviherbaspirillum sp.]
MMSEHLRIGELAERTGKSIHALRYYEQVGLIPFVERDDGGRRRYNVQHVEWLLFLDRLQRTGMTLSQMQKYAELVARGRQTLDARVELLLVHLAEIERQMEELAASRALLMAKLDFYRDWKSSGKRPGQQWAAMLHSTTDGAKPSPKRIARGSGGR